MYYRRHRSSTGPFVGIWFGVSLLYWIDAAFITDGQAGLACLAIGPALGLALAWILTLINPS